MWKGIKKIISSNNSSDIFLTAITVNNEAITNLSDSNLILILSNLSILHQIFQEKIFSLPPVPKYRIIFITPTQSTEVSNIIFSLNQDKSDGTNSSPIKILPMLNKEISDQLAILSIFYLWNISFNFESQ